MQPIVQPILRIPLKADANGSTWTPQLDIIPAGPTLSIRQPGIPRDWTDTALWHAPTAASLLLLLCLAFLWRSTRRALARPQSEHALYCRRCNYELTTPAAGYSDCGRPQWLDPAGRCSECGSSRAPIRGRSRARRLWIPLTIAGVLALACAATLFLTLSPMSRFGGGAWPVAGAEKALGRWALQHRHRERQLVHHINLWDLPHQSELGTLGPFPVYGMANGLITPDGRRFVYIAEPIPSPRWSMPVIVANIETGAQFTVLNDPEPGVTRTLVGLSADGHTAYIQSYHYSPDPEYRLTLEAVDLDSLRPTEITEVDTPYTTMPGGSRQASAQQFAVDAPGNWCLLTWGAASGPNTPVHITAPDQSSQRELTVSLPAFSNIHARPAGPGAIDARLWPAGATWRIDLKTGSATALPAAAGVPMGNSPDGRYELRWQSPTLLLIDTTTNTPLAQLAVPGSIPVTGGTVSPDGRWAAVQTSPTPGPQQILVWDTGAKP